MTGRISAPLHPCAIAALAAAALLAVRPGHVAAQHSSAEDWVEVAPGGDTGCAFGTPYRFFVRELSEPEGLLVYFEGGGACWDWVSCSGMFDSTVADDELSRHAGIFDFDRRDDPFARYSVVFVPYCTGDVHVGDTVARYGDPDWDARPVEHRGAANVSAVLEWLEAGLAAPERLVVAGASAGSYGAIFHAPSLAALFPGAALTVIGDSGVPLLHGYPHILASWGADRVLRALWARAGAGTEHGAATTVSLEEAHRRIVLLRPDVRLALITTDRDAVQSAFYLYSGSPSWREETLSLLEGLGSELRPFRAFVVEGEDHGLMRTDRFYEYEADGVRLRDWIARLVRGEAVESRYCGTCR